MIQTNNSQQAKNLLKTEKSPKMIKAGEDVFNRSMLEYGKFDVLLSIEAGNRKDSLRSIDSGFNEVLARIAAKNNIAIGIDLEEIRALPRKEKALRISKIRQNIRLCRKASVKLALIGMKDKRDAESFLIVAGASTNQLKRALLFFKDQE